jgi:Nif-specific regulatory protein
LELIIDTATRMMQAKRLSPFGSENRKLYFKVVIGKKGRSQEMEWTSGRNRRVVAEKEPSDQDVRKDPRWFKQISDSIGFQTRSIACVP